MSENVRALIVVLILATGVFVIARTPARTMASAPEEFERRRNLWYGITLAGFLSFNFWLFLLLAGGLLRRAAKKETNIAAMVLFVLLTIPLFSAEIPGVGGIRYLFKVNYLYLISFVVLLPIFIRETQKHSLKYFMDDKPSRYLYSYLILDVALTFAASDFSDVTGTVRIVIGHLLGIALPFAVISRSIKDDVALRTAIGCYVLGASVMATVGIVEGVRHWLLYSSLERALGVNWGTIYLARGDSLRAVASTGQAIAFGYAMAVGFVLMLGLRHVFQKRVLWLAGLALLFVGMLSSYSRGPWLGAAAGYLVFVVTGPRRWSNIGLLTVVGVVGLAVLLVTPMGDKLYRSLVTVDEGSYEYRALLFDRTIDVILQNPIFGSKGVYVIDQLEELRQGQGIIDIVNSYIAVALNNGFVGLFLFVGFFVSAVFMIAKRMRSILDKNSEAMDLGRVLLAAIACIMVSIYNVSGISVIPIIYYLMVALAVVYARSTGNPADTLQPRIGTLRKDARRPRRQRLLIGTVPR